MYRAANPYLQAIEDPFRFCGAKIPDLVTTPSCCFSLLDRRTLATNAGGLCMIAYGCGLDGAAKGSLIPMDPNYNFGTVSNGTLTINDLFNGGGSFTVTSWNSANATVPANFTYARLVSAAVTFSFLGTITSTAGKISAAFFPKGKLESLRGSGALTLDQLESQPDAIIIPINQLKQVTLRYRPQDNSVLQYATTNASSSAINPTVDGTYMPGTFICVVSGASASGLNLQAVGQFNYEAIVKDNKFAPVFCASQSISDPLALSHAYNSAAKMQVASTNSSVAYATGNTTQVNPSARTMSSHPPTGAQSKPMFETLFEGIPTYIKEGSSALARLAPLLMALA